MSVKPAPNTMADKSALAVRHSTPSGGEPAAPSDVSVYTDSAIKENTDVQTFGFWCHSTYFRSVNECIQALPSFQDGLLDKEYANVIQEAGIGIANVYDEAEEVQKSAMAAFYDFAMANMPEWTKFKKSKTYKNTWKPFEEAVNYRKQNKKRV